MTKMAATMSTLTLDEGNIAVLEPEAMAPPVNGRLRDKFGRAITDLRVSVTDRCNYKCVYCRTGNEGAQYTELPIADYLRMARLFVSLGVEKVRLTGGEPLLRSGLLEMVRELGKMRTAYLHDGTFVGEAGGSPLDIALTTNGHLLEGLAQPLKDAGLKRVTVSMDAVDAETFTAITRVPRSFDKVLAGIRKAQAVGLGPVKVNCVLLRGFNDSQIEQFAEFSRNEGVIVRFIEWMPLEEDRSWKRETVISMDEIVARLNAYRPLVELAPHAASETAKRFTFDDGVGEIGIVAPVSRPFCGHCSRVRLTSDGKIRTCLSHRVITICLERWFAVEPMSSWLRIYARLLCAKRRGITSANLASKNLRATWSTLADELRVVITDSILLISDMLLAGG